MEVKPAADSDPASSWQGGGGWEGKRVGASVGGLPLNKKKEKKSTKTFSAQGQYQGRQSCGDVVAAECIHPNARP